MKNLYKYLFYLFFIGFGCTLYYVLLLKNVYSPIFEAIAILMGITMIIFLMIFIDMASAAGEERKHENVESKNLGDE
ncbi:Uncharacterised protein [Streptococcus pneumoniae]|nr:Uncharacterised protein [Streptococcus pneumoniae]